MGVKIQIVLSLIIGSAFGSTDGSFCTLMLDHVIVKSSSIFSIPTQKMANPDQVFATSDRRIKLEVLTFWRLPYILSKYYLVNLLL